MGQGWLENIPDFFLNMVVHTPHLPCLARQITNVLVSQRGALLPIASKGIVEGEPNLFPNILPLNI